MASAEVEIVVAFLDKDQGFAFGNTLPWPYLKKDYEFYTNLISSRKDPSKLNANITGLVSWESRADDQKSNPHFYSVVTSNTLKAEGVPYLRKVVPTLDEAITHVSTPPISDQIEKIYIMGGRQNYEECIEDPRLTRIWVTRVFGDFKADVFFPKFQHKFKRVKCDTLDESMQEDNGVRYQFELWERFAD